MRAWTKVLMAAVLVVGVGAGCGGTEQEAQSGSSGSSALASYLERGTEALGDDDNQCPSKKFCKDIDGDKNITHVFFDFPSKKNLEPGKDFKVYSYTDQRGWEEVTDRVKDKGGPCQELSLNYRFELPGPDRHAKVCVAFKDKSYKVEFGHKEDGLCKKDGKGKCKDGDHVQ
ncbi:hypothetical protein JQX13_21480 [Archangium violaceum]|uniref:hypothetical protein n=1 Tax=Archangium violaceum TaxID=83451 RepID=UPI00193AE26B|nr:hypothetical protein [Archangium violaceum]QRK12367.1 hypothetical protein JQX13_21480 [Archangium violaceum]